ncbi:MAG: hypothetical protein H6825_16200 [Planctomycetes bacterium]|nr:hypothetical protein [Planctomycetota bacterium]
MVRRSRAESVALAEASEPLALPHRAADDLRFIRRTMETSGAFTSLPGSTGLALSATAFAAAGGASLVDDDTRWLSVWIGAAILAALLGVLFVERRARGMGTSLLGLQGRRFLLGLLPAIVAGAVLTFVLHSGGLTRSLPGVWLLLYGVGVTTAGLLSLRLLLVMGPLFMLLGVGALLTSPVGGDLWMAAGFGGLDLVFALVLRKISR